MIATHRTFLRLGARVLELLDEPLTVGRSAAADIRIFDDLASREHCRIEARDGRVLVEDLGSQNGTLVNEAPIDGPRELSHGDRITIGGRQITVLRQLHTPSPARPPSDLPLVGDLAGGDTSLQSPTATPFPGATRTASLFDVYATAATVALREGEILNAEFAARSVFSSIISALQSRRRPDVGVLHRSSDIFLQLAEQTGDAQWLRKVLVMHAAARLPLAEQNAERFAELADRVGTPHELLRAYLQRVDERAEPARLKALAGSDLDD